MASTMNMIMGVDLLFGMEVSMLFGGGERLNSAQNRVRIAMSRESKAFLSDPSRQTPIIERT